MSTRREHRATAPSPDASPGTVTRLGPCLTGRWLVTTQGSTHVGDLGLMTYERRPGPTSRAGGFTHDRVPHPITRVQLWPELGSRSWVWLDDPDDNTIEHYRISSTVVEIRRLTDPAPDAVTGQPPPGFDDGTIRT